MPATFLDYRNSRAPQALGVCATDRSQLLPIINEAIQRLMEVAKNQGFWETTKQVVFTVVDNYITGPRQVARLEDVTVCGQAVNIRNGFWEYLASGAGLQPSNACTAICSSAQSVSAIDRGLVPTARDIDPTNQGVRVYMTDSRDAGLRVLVQGLDSNGLPIRSQDGQDWVNGVYLVLATPFTDLVDPVSGLPYALSKITGIQKDITFGQVPIYQVDLTTGTQVLLSRYEFDETQPSYRRYYLNNLPSSCCGSNPPTQVIGMARMEFVPVALDSDWLPISSIPALVAETQAIRYGDMETEFAQKMAVMKHREAVRLLNNQLDHRTGRRHIAVGVDNFERDSLYRVNIGMQ